MARPKVQSQGQEKCTCSSARSQQLAWVCTDAVVAALLLPHQEVVCEAKQRGRNGGKQVSSTHAQQTLSA